MTPVEKLLVQLCQRKHSIINLVKQQTESYSQQLACEFLIDGITPPSWLWDPNTSASKELSKEDLISKILHPYPRPSVCCSVAHCPAYTNLVITGDNEELSDGDFVQNPAFNKDLDRKNDLTTPGFSGQDRGECVLNWMPELDASVASPEDQTDGRILNIYTAPDQSLAGMQRSKSRQKALELRSSAKALAKSGLRHKSTSDVVSSQIRFSLSIANQPGQSDELSQSAEPSVIGSQSCEERNVVEAHCLSRKTGVDTYSERITRSGSYAEVPISVEGSLPLVCSSKNYKENASFQDARAKRTESLPILGSELSDHLYKRSSKSAEPSAVCCQSFRDMRVEDADFLCENEETNVYTGEIIRSGVSSKRQSCGCDSTNADRSSDDNQGMDITVMDSGGQPPDCIDGFLVKVNLSSDRNEGCDARESVVEDFGSSEVQDEADNLLSKMVDITGIQSPTVKLHVKHGLESSLVEQGCGDEGRDKGQLVSVVPERKNSRLSYVYSSADDSVVQSYGCSIKKAGTNPIAINEIKEYTALQSQMLPCPQGEVFNEHGNSSLETKSFERPSTVKLQGKNSSLSRIFTHARTESWPQAKRRKIGFQQTHSFTTSKCFRVAKPHSFQRDPGNMYPKTMEVDIDTGRMEHVNMSMDDGICSEVNTDRMEVIQSAMLSQHGEVESCYIKMNDRKNTSPVTNNDLATISSLAMKESRNSQRCLIEGTRTSPSSCDYLGSRTSGDKQCSEHLCNLENDGDNLNTENLDLSSTLYKETQSPKWEDGLHVHHSVLSSSNEDLQLTDVDQSMSIFEDGLHVHHSVLSSSNEDLQLTDVDQSMPVFEGFTVNTPADTGELDFAADGFDLGKLELPRTTLERASILAEICRSASLDRPSSHFASAFKFQETWNLCKSVPDDGHLEHIESGDIYSLNPDVGIHFQCRSSFTDDYKDALDGMPYSVPLAYSAERYDWNSRNQLSSPVGKLWDQLSSHTGSSGKCSSSNPELTCFPIEEDPSSSEDNKIMEENAGDTQDETESSLANHSNKRQPLEDLTNMGKISAEEVTLRADSLDFLTSKLSVTRTQDKTLLGPKYQCMKKSETREEQTSSIGAADGRKRQLSSIAPNAIKKAKQSVNNSTRKSMRNKISKTIVLNKTSLKEQDQKVSLTESRRNNIVSNVSSFIPLVQQKQAVADCTGKRDVKVKALEAAEAAKRLEERKENERKMRKEALKIERAKLEEKNLRDIVLEKKRKEEERKKKDADIIAKKRLREEEERKEQEKKRMRVEARQRQREQEEKKRAERPEKENQRTKDAQTNTKKEFNNESKRQQNRETTKGEGVTLQKTETNLTLNEVVVNYEECGISGLSCEAGEAMDTVDKTPRKEHLLVQNSKGKSYEISPYQCSEDEDEGDDELPTTKKYIPSWASKSSIALFLPLQQELDPDVIFPPDRFCSMDAVLLPRKLRQQQAAT